MGHCFHQLGRLGKPQPFEFRDDVGNLAFYPVRTPRRFSSRP